MRELLNLLSSERKLEILQTLYPGTKSRAELKRELDISSSALTTILKEMIDLDLVEDHDRKYSALPKGRYVLEIAKSVEGHADFIERFRPFINRYELDDLPSHLTRRLYELKDFEVVEDSGKIYKPHENFIRIL